MTNTTDSKLSTATRKGAESSIRKYFKGRANTGLRAKLHAALGADDPVAAIRGIERGVALHFPIYTRQIADELAADIARDQRVARDQAEARAALAANRCPVCGRSVRRNLSITGWVQCSQLGADTHRADPSQPPCAWQGFTS
jgi:hypothetical protein